MSLKKRLKLAAAARAVLGAILCLSMSGAIALADTVGWHPSLTWQLGEGVNYNHQREIKPIVALMGSSSSNSPPSGAGTDFIFHLAQSAGSIANTLHVNQQVGFEFESFGDGSTGIDFIDQFQISASDLTFVMRYSHDFGNALFPILGIDPSASNVLQSLRQQGLAGSDLHKKFTSLYGTHFVHGYHAVANASAFYTIHFRDRTRLDELGFNADGSFDADISSGTFVGFLTNTLTQSAGSITMDYQFNSSDNSANPLSIPFPVSGVIADTNQFAQFLTSFAGYVNSMRPENAQIQEWIIDPIEIIPGYRSIIQTNVAAVVPADFGAVQNEYYKLVYYDRLLSDWTTAQGGMNWMAENAQRQAFSALREVETELQRIKSMGQAYFTNGGPLTTNSLTVAAALSQLPFPTINVSVARPAESEHDYFTIGYVNCGPSSLVTTNSVPFANVIWQFPPSSPYNPIPSTLFYSAQDFLDELSRAEYDFGTGTGLGASYWHNNAVVPFLSGPIWRDFTNGVSCTLGFFVAYQSLQPSDLEGSKFVLLDNSGQIVDSFPVLQIRENTCSSPNPLAVFQPLHPKERIK